MSERRQQHSSSRPAGWEPPDLTPDPRTRQLRPPRPGKASRAVRFMGYLGESHRPDHVRLYVDPDLLSWLEIARRDILHRENLPQTPDVTVLWVKRTAPVAHGKISALQMQAEMLKGELIRRYLPDSFTDDMIVSGFTTTVWCAAAAATWYLCITPSCGDVTHLLNCDPLGDDDDRDNGDDDGENGGDGGDTGDDDGPEDTGEDEPETETPTG